MKQKTKATGDDCPECIADSCGDLITVQIDQRPLVFLPGHDQTRNEPAEPDVMWCEYCGGEWLVDVAREFPPKRNRDDVAAIVAGLLVSAVLLFLVWWCSP